MEIFLYGVVHQLIKNVVTGHLVSLFVDFPSNKIYKGISKQVVSSVVVVFNGSGFPDSKLVLEIVLRRSDAHFRVFVFFFRLVYGLF